MAAVQIHRKSLYFVFILSLLCGLPGSASFAREGMRDHETVRLQALDKTTARTRTFTANVGDTVKYGPLFIKVRACRKAPPIEKPESAAFLQIWEMTPDGKAEWVYSGWMFASSPALAAMNHPVYDVWVLDCLTPVIDDTGPEPTSGADPESASESEQTSDPGAYRP